MCVVTLGCMKITCTVEDYPGIPCGREISARGLCKMHYERHRVRGTVRNQRRLGPIELRFWSWVDRGTHDECWLWTGRLDPRGYGRFDHEQKPQLAHRIAWLLTHGSMPEEPTLDHDCHNRSDCMGGDGCVHRRCVNPSHLVPRGVAENVAASPRAGRYKTHCLHGHLYDDENTYHGVDGRRCRECGRERNRRRRPQQLAYQRLWRARRRGSV